MKKTGVKKESKNEEPLKRLTNKPTMVVKT